MKKLFLEQTDNWYLERIIWLLAGATTLISISLGIFHNSYWFILTAIVGINQIILSLTGFCPMTALLNKLGIKSRIV